MASMASQAALALLEQAINAALSLDPKTGKRLQRLDGKIIAIALLGLDLTLYLQAHQGGLRLMGAWDGPVDTRLRGAPLALLRMSGGRRGDGLFRGGVEIEGDVELGQQIQRVFSQIDIDWEEHLARLSGDVIAHQIGNLLRELRAFGGRSAQHLGQDLADYLHHEDESLPLDWELQDFYSEVDGLRSDVDRLEARLTRLHGKVKQGD
ncbi:MAG: SCP2 domain-containing protein [Thiohalomonadaceae bacterium]